MKPFQDYEESRAFFRDKCSGPVSVKLKGVKWAKTMFWAHNAGDTIISVPYHRYAYHRGVFHIYNISANNPRHLVQSL